MLLKSNQNIRTTNSRWYWKEEGIIPISLDKQTRKNEGWASFDDASKINTGNHQFLCTILKMRMVGPIAANRMLVRVTHKSNRKFSAKICNYNMKAKVQRKSNLSDNQYNSQVNSVLVWNNMSGGAPNVLYVRYMLKIWLTPLDIYLT